MVTASGKQSIWGYVAKVLPLELVKVSAVCDCKVAIWHCSPALNTRNHIHFLPIIPLELLFKNKLIQLKRFLDLQKIEHSAVC